MTHFLPTFLQKRILRYALSRLELLDTDALDLENLDIVWGKKSRIELRDVGVHIDRISALLKLPQSLTIQKARISSLRVIIPADLYKSSIVLKADGIDITIRTDTGGGEQEAATNKEKSSEIRPRNSSKTNKADRSRDTPPIVHDPGGWPDSEEYLEDEDAQLSTTLGLAQSFVQAEPTEERSELQAAVAKSLHLSQSQTSSDDGLDASELGIGNEIYLPAFLAGFLKGVGDRVQVDVKNVKVDLDMSLAGKDDTQSVEDVKIRLVIGSIFVAEASPSSTKANTRRIAMKSVHLLIISEPSLFSNLARSTAPSSPAMTQASTILTAPSKSNESSPSMTNAKFPPEDMERRVADLKESQTSIFSTQESAADQEDESPADSVIQSADDSIATGSHHESSMFADSFYSSGAPSDLDNEETEPLQPLRDSSVFGTAFDGTASMRYPRKPDTSQDFSDAPESPPAAFSASLSSISQDMTRPKETHNGISQTPDAEEAAMSTRDSSGSLSRTSSEGNKPSSLSAQDLSESKIFSHEEAESMYMSALSTNPVHQSERISNIPGGWQSFHESAQQILQLAPPEALQDESDMKGPLPPTADEANGRGHKANEIGELNRSMTPTNLQDANQELQKSPTSKIDPAIGSTTAGSSQKVASSQDSVSPSGSGRDQSVLAKRILLIDDVVVQLPIENAETSSYFSGTHSTQGEASGSLSAKPGCGPTTSTKTATGHDLGRSSKAAPNEEPLEPATAIKIGSMQVVGDVGLTKLTILIVERLSALHESSSPRKRKSNSHSPSTRAYFTVAIDSISWRFLDLVRGSRTSNSAPPESFSKNMLLSEGSDVLLRSNISHVQLKYTKTKYRSVTKLLINKFLIGYADNNILSFDAALRLRDSTRDISIPDKDVDLTITETIDILSIDVTTLPLHIVLDLRRLDETFSWFGGFSSMLGLGSSMVSTVTLLDPKTKSLPSSNPSRGVHFERLTPERSLHQASGSIKQQRKIAARMGGLVFDLKGTKTALQIESTAMKLISRSEGIGLQIDRLILSGPVTYGDDADLPTVGKLSNVRVEYLTTPKENDLTRLLTLLAPSKDTYDDGDDILVDTLIRQRKKGGVLRATVESADVRILDPHALQCFPLLAEEAKKLSTVAKYLPEDDRPGLLTLLLIKSTKVEVHTNIAFGRVSFDATNAELAHVTFPMLMALGISHCSLSRNDTEGLLCNALSSDIDAALPTPPPMIMARFIGNEMEPTVKMKFHNTQFEYHVPIIMALMELKDNMATEEIVSDMISSVATLTSRRAATSAPPKLSSQGSGSSINSVNGSRALGINVIFRDSIFGLNPRASQAKGLVVLTDIHFIGSMPKGEDANATLEIKKAELMIVDDIGNVHKQEPLYPRKDMDTYSTQVQALAETGYVSVSQISAARVILQVVQLKPELGPAVDVEIKDDLFILESCADSTQTVTDILNGLKPPMPKSTALKYQTEVVPVEDMLASFSGEAFEMSKANPRGEEEISDLEDGDMVDDEVPENMEFLSSFYNPDPETSVSDTMADSVLDDDLDSIATPSMLREVGDKNLLESFQEQSEVVHDQLALDFQDEHFGSDSSVGVATRRWNPKHNKYNPTKERLHHYPLRVRIRDVHIIWNLFDGYDWQHTRDTISQAVAQVQHKAEERQAARKRKSFDPEDEDEDVIGDFLFNSIYIGIPAKSDPVDLARQINRNIDDLVSETGSYATSTSAGASPSRAQPPKPRGKRLRLQRSKHHKLTFELKGVCADFVVFPPGSAETVSSLDIRVQDLDIFDHVPTSTWKKFATYMHDAGERESGSSMIHLEILNIKPVPNLAASEIVLKVSLYALPPSPANTSRGICPAATSTR